MDEENAQPITTRSFTISGMPMGDYLAWKQDAVDNFGDCYWMKAKADHEYKQADIKMRMLYDIIEGLKQEVQELKIEISSLKEHPKGKEIIETFRSDKDE